MQPCLPNFPSSALVIAASSRDWSPWIPTKCVFHLRVFFATLETGMLTSRTTQATIGITVALLLFREETCSSFNWFSLPFIYLYLKYCPGSDCFFFCFSRIISKDTFFFRKPESEVWMSQTMEEEGDILTSSPVEMAFLNSMWTLLSTIFSQSLCPSDVSFPVCVCRAEGHLLRCFDYHRHDDADVSSSEVWVPNKIMESYQLDSGSVIYVSSSELFCADHFFFLFLFLVSWVVEAEGIADLCFMGNFWSDIFSEIESSGW